MESSPIWGRLILCLGVFSIGISLLSAPTFAATDPAELMIRSGVELRRQGRNEDALPKFQGAYELSRSSRAAAQLGLCEQTLEMWEEAEQHLSEALLGQSDPWVTRNRKVLEEARARGRENLVSVQLLVEPAEAMITVNDVTVGRAAEASTVWLKEGDLLVTASLAGFESQSFKRRMKAGDSTQVKMKLAKPTAPPRISAAASSTEAPPQSAPLGGPAATDVQASDSVHAEPRNWRPYVGWGAVGVGTVGLGVGLLGYLAHNNAVSGFNKLGCLKGEGVIVGPEGCEGFDKDVGSAKTQVAVGLIGAAVFGGLGAWLLTSGGSGANTESAVGPIWGVCKPEGGVYPGAGLSVGCRGQF